LKQRDKKDLGAGLGGLRQYDWVTVYGCSSLLCFNMTEDDILKLDASMVEPLFTKEQA
jgi:hypothetical protein